MLDAKIRTALNCGGVLVDLGCGGGEALDELTACFETAIGLDVSPVQLRHGLGPAARWKFVQTDLDEPFPLPSAFADAALANQVIEHMRDPVHFLAETHRILKTNGLLVLTTPNIRYVKHAVRLLILGRGPSTANGNTSNGSWDDGHLHYFTHADLRALLASCGFHCIRSEALVNRRGGGAARRLLDGYSAAPPVREFLSGNALVVARKA